MAGNMHTCRACGKHYYACDPCDQRLGKSWRATYCCEEHREAYQLLISYVRGNVSKAEAKEALEKMGAQDWTESTSYPTISEILAEDKPGEVVEEKVEEVVEETPVVEEAVPEVKEEAPVEVATSGYVATEEAKPVVETKTTYASGNNWNKNNNYNNYYKGKKRR